MRTKGSSSCVQDARKTQCEGNSLWPVIKFGTRIKKVLCRLSSLKKVGREETEMDIIFGMIELGCLLGIGLYIGFEGMNALIEISAEAINFILRKTMETRKSDDEWSA